MVIYLNAIDPGINIIQYVLSFVIVGFERSELHGTKFELELVDMLETRNTRKILRACAKWMRPRLDSNFRIFLHKQKSVLKISR